MKKDINDVLTQYTVEIVAAHVSNNSLAIDDLPDLIAKVHGALAALNGTSEAPEARQQPKVTVRASIKPDYLVCLEDGKRMKMLKRYLMTNYKMTPDQYRQKWDLNSDYPMVAPNYAAQRRELAKSIGLGRRPRKAGQARKAKAAKAAKAGN